MFVSAERLQSTDPGRLTTADLVVEVLSPSTAMYDRTTKADTYAALKVGELWLIDTSKKTIEQRVLGPAGWNPPASPRHWRYCSGSPISRIYVREQSNFRLISALSFFLPFPLLSISPFRPSFPLLFQRPCRYQLSDLLLAVAKDLL